MWQEGQDQVSGLLTPNPRSFLITAPEKRWDFIQMTLLQSPITECPQRELGEATEGCCLSESAQSKGVAGVRGGRRRHRTGFKSLSKITLPVKKAGVTHQGHMCHVIYKEEISWPNYYNPRGRIRLTGSEPELFL